MSLQRQLEAIQVAYSTAVAENQLEDDFAEHLAEGHAEEVKWTQDHSETMLLALDMRGLQIVKMTSKLSQFQSICREDRFLLHHYNQDLFKQYILAKYMKTWDGNDCLQLLCDNQQVENPQRQLFYDLNQWGNFLPDKIANNCAFWNCIDTIYDDYRYPTYFNAVIGYYIILSTQQWPKVQLSQLKDPKKIQELHSNAEEVFLHAWNTCNVSTLSNINGQLDTFIRTLYTMASSSTNSLSWSEVTSVVCSVEENQWIRESMSQMNDAFQTYQFSHDMIQDMIECSRGNYIHYERITNQYGPLAMKRMDIILASFGQYNLNMSNFQSLILLQIMKGGSCKHLDEQMGWLLGLQDHGLPVANSPPFNLYQLLCHRGAFVHRKQEQLCFKETWGQMMTFLKDNTVTHLLMMTTLLDMLETQDKMKRYQSCLTKKLNEFSDEVGSESGYQAYCSFQRSFSDLKKLMGRFQQEVEEKLQKSCQLKQKQAEMSHRAL